MPTVFDRPQSIQPRLLDKLRIPDLKAILNYIKTSHPEISRQQLAVHRKADYIAQLHDELRNLYNAHSKVGYGRTLSFMRFLSSGLQMFDKFQWHDNRAHSIPEDMDWVRFLPVNFQASTGSAAFSRRPSQPRPSQQYHSSIGIPGAVPGGLVNGQFLSSPAAPARAPASHHRPRSSEMSGLAKIAFSDSSFLAPYSKVGDIVVCRETRGRQVSVNFKFKLSADQVDMLTKNMDRPQRAQYGVYLYMCQYALATSFANQPSQNTLAVQYPSMCSVVVNGRSIQRPPQRPNQEAPPWNLMDQVNLQMGIDNSVCIIYTSHTSWVAVAMLVRQHTAESIAEQIRQVSFVDAETVRQQFFRPVGNADDDVVADGALVSLKCPLGLVRITTPMRSKYCNHSQCFDGEVFLKMNEQTPTWKCPICSIAVKSWQELIVDGYFEEILRGTQDSDDQVHVDPDGAWRRKEAAATALVASSGKHSRSSAGEAIDLSDVEVSESGPSSKRSRTEVVDLTLDSDSDSDGEAEMNELLADLENDSEWVDEAVSQAEVNSQPGTQSSASIPQSQNGSAGSHPNRNYSSSSHAPMLPSPWMQTPQTNGNRSGTAATADGQNTNPDPRQLPNPRKRRSSSVCATLGAPSNGNGGMDMSVSGPAANNLLVLPAMQTRPQQANGDGSGTSANGSSSTFSSRPFTNTSTTRTPPTVAHNTANRTGHSSQGTDSRATNDTGAHGGNLPAGRPGRDQLASPVPGLPANWASQTGAFTCQAEEYSSFPGDSPAQGSGSAAQQQTAEQVTEADAVHAAEGARSRQQLPPTPTQPGTASVSSSGSADPAVQLQLHSSPESAAPHRTAGGNGSPESLARGSVPEHEGHRQQLVVPEQRTATPPASSGITIATASIQQRRDPFKFKPSTKAASKRSRVRVIDASDTSPSTNGSASTYRPPYCGSLGMSSGPPPAAFMRSPMASATVTPNYTNRTLPPILAAPATAPMTLHRSDVLDSAPLTPTRNPLQHLGSSSPPSSSMVGMSPTYKALFTNAGAGSSRVFGSGSNSDDTAGF